jgi:RNA polymerase sigma-70 factor (ECF subfamily)
MSETATMAEDPSFDELIERLRKGDNAAATRVFHRFQRRLIAVTYQHLESRLAAKVDPEDVVQSVFRTLFNRLAEGQFQLEDWDSLWGLLTRIALRKCSKWSDYFHTQGRDINREVSPPAATDQSESGWEFIDREPTPHEAVTLAETLDEILRGLNERERKIAILKLEGCNLSEIAERVPCTFRKANQVLEHIRGRLERMRDLPVQESRG